MIAYEIYLRDEMGGFHLIGILPERRKNPLRITQESVIKWGKMVAHDDIDVNDMYFARIEV